MDVSPVNSADKAIKLTRLTRRGKKILLVFELELNTKAFQQFVWSPYFFVSILKPEVIKQGLSPLHNFEIHFTDMLLIFASFEVPCKGTIRQNTEEGLKRMQQAVESTHLKMMKIANKTLPLLLD